MVVFSKWTKYKKSHSHNQTDCRVCVLGMRLFLMGALYCTQLDLMAKLTRLHWTNQKLLRVGPLHS